MIRGCDWALCDRKAEFHYRGGLEFCELHYDYMEARRICVSCGAYIQDGRFEEYWLKTDGGITERCHRCPEEWEATEVPA